MTQDQVSNNRQLKEQLLDAIATYGLKLDQKNLAKAKSSPVDFENRCYEWLAAKAPLAKSLIAATHVSKLTHPDAPARASLFDLGAPHNPELLPGLVSTHSLPTPEVDFVGTAAALPLANLLRTVLDGNTLYRLLRDNDSRLIDVLGRNVKEASEIIEHLSAVRIEKAPFISPVMKQVYWLAGEDAADDAQFHLLIPLTSSALTHAQHVRLKERYSDEARDARRAHADGKPSELVDRRYPSMRTIKVGGTKPYNISALHAARGGALQMFSCAPPSWRTVQVKPILYRESIFGSRGIFGRRQGVAQALDGLAGFLRRRYLPANIQTRTQVAGYVQQLIDELIGMSVEYSALPVGWSLEKACQLQPSQKLLLDPGSRNLNESLAKLWLEGTWAYDVGGRVALLLVERLRKSGIAVEEAREGDFWTRVIAVALLDYARGLPPSVPAQLTKEVV